MGDADLSGIERALGYPLPGEYRDFLRRHGDEVRRIKDVLPFRAVLWTDAGDIIRANRDPTGCAPFAIGEDSGPWPEEFLLVGTNGGGDYWFVDRAGGKWGFWFWQSESQDIEEQYDSFEAYLAELRRDAGDPGQWQRQPGR